jgi:filamentous hemagglutinin
MPNTNGFRPGSALSHWGFHAHEFTVRPSDAAVYEMMADAFFGARLPGVAEAQRRGNGDLVRFDPWTDHFGVLDKNGHIKTFYKANPAIHGERTNADYFIREIRK